MSNTQDKNQKEKDQEEKTATKPKEIGGAKGLEPTRYGDWQHGGRVSDF